MKDNSQVSKRTLGPSVSVQTVRLLPHERDHLEKLQAAAGKREQRRVPFNEIMVKGLMRLKKA